jgi:hypothetical protein
MGSISIEEILKSYPGKSEAEAAAAYAREYGYVVIVKYRKSPAAEFDNFGCCSKYDQLKGYFDSPYCYDTEVVYDSKNDPEGYQEIKCPQCNYPLTVKKVVTETTCGICSAKISLSSGKVSGYQRDPYEGETTWEYGAIRLSDGIYAARRDKNTGVVYGKVSQQGGWTWVHPNVAETFFYTGIEYPPLT